MAQNLKKNLIFGIAVVVCASHVVKRPSKRSAVAHLQNVYIVKLTGSRG